MGKLFGHYFHLPMVIFCAQIVKKQQCLNIVFNFLKLLWFKPFSRKMLLFRICLHVIKNWILKILVITSVCRGRAAVGTFGDMNVNLHAVRMTSLWRHLLVLVQSALSNFVKLTPYVQRLRPTFVSPTSLMCFLPLPCP